MSITFSGRIAPVTGSTRGIGLAIARGFAAAGAETIVIAAVRRRSTRSSAS